MAQASPFCNYEHLGGCSEQLTHRADYWLGEARQRFGRFAYWCDAHASSAQHLGLEKLSRTIKRQSQEKLTMKAATLALVLAASIAAATGCNNDSLTSPTGPKPLGLGQHKPIYTPTPDPTDHPNAMVVSCAEGYSVVIVPGALATGDGYQCAWDGE